MKPHRGKLRGIYSAHKGMPQQHMSQALIMGLEDGERALQGALDKRIVRQQLSPCIAPRRNTLVQFPIVHRMAWASELLSPPSQIEAYASSCKDPFCTFPSAAECCTGAKMTHAPPNKMADKSSSSLLRLMAMRQRVYRTSGVFFLSSLLRVLSKVLDAHTGQPPLSAPWHPRPLEPLQSQVCFLARWQMPRGAVAPASRVHTKSHEQAPQGPLVEG